MKRQDIFLVGCLLTALSFLYLESSSFDFQPVNSLSAPNLSNEEYRKSTAKETPLHALTKSKVVEKEVATVE